MKKKSTTHFGVNREITIDWGEQEGLKRELALYMG